MKAPVQHASRGVNHIQMLTTRTSAPLPSPAPSTRPRGDEGDREREEEKKGGKEGSGERRSIAAIKTRAEKERELDD